MDKKSVTEKDRKQSMANFPVFYGHLEAPNQGVNIKPGFK